MTKPVLFTFTSIFLALFALRLGFGYVSQPNGEVLTTPNYSNESYDFELSRKNYAGQNAAKSSLGAMPASVDQRFEKVAALGLSSSDFDADESRLRHLAETADALIQHEQAFGLAGRRQLQLALGVPPDNFDSTITEIRNIGRLTGFQVNKLDKTNEYRALLAQQISLQKSRDNLVALKSRDADLAALIALETRILELENEIQSLGVSVGEFDSEFEFVTIKLTLFETAAPTIRNLSLLYRSKVAVEWAVLATMGLMAAFVAFLGGLALFAVVAREFRKTKGADL